jgi:hypothetical protein
MSSSLDDLEPYEIFQYELDGYLKDYQKTLTSIDNKISNSHLLLINTFIEYICFIKSRTNFKELTIEEVKFEFMDFVTAKFKNEFDKKEVINALHGYLNYIYNIKGNPSPELINSLKF